ncbi:MAG: ADOP family duplicated permease [Bryobacteraceae bacterium]
MFARVRSWWRAATGRREFESNMSAELRFHIEQYAEDLVRSGASKQEAYRRARMELGALNSVKENCREARGLLFIDEIGRDARFAARLLRKSPAFTTAALLTLALCLGANLTIFAVIDAILVRPLPFPEAGRLVTIFNTYPKAGVERDGSSITNYYERRGKIAALSSVSMYGFGTAVVGEPGSTVVLEVTRIAPKFFATLGAGPALGREFTDAEMNPQTDQAAILTYEYWRNHFAADAGVIGREVWIDGSPKTVIGVLPRGIRFLSSTAQIYLPLSSSLEQRMPQERHSGGNVRQMIARLKPGTTIEQAQAEIDAQNTALERDDPEAKMMADAGFRSLVVSLHGDQVAAVRPILLLLQAGVLALLLIGAVNLENLLLIRASGRLKEIAVRQALGASRRHVVIEIFVETFVLTLAGGLLAMAMGAGGVRLLNALGAQRLPLSAFIVFDARLALVGFVVAIGLGLALAVPVTWFNLRSLPAHGLQAESRGATTGRAAQALRHAFIVAQIALGFVLLASSGLLGLSLKRAVAVSPGFRADHAVAGQVSLIGNRYPSPKAGLVFTGKLVHELERRPGVLFAGITTNIPFSARNGKSAATVKGEVVRPGESPRGYYSYGVSGEYFQAMGLPLRAGRFLTAEDSQRKERTCVVDEDFARYHWPKGKALGQKLFQGSQARGDAEAFTVVGVVGSVKQTGLTDDTTQGAVYYPYTYRADNNIFVVVRGSVGVEPLKMDLQSAVRQVDPAVAVTGTESMDERIAESLLLRRSPALLGGIFSGIAMLLIAIGIYGVLSYAVAQRQREIGIRIALGARPVDIRGQFLSLGLRLLVAGVVIGLSGAWIMGRTMEAVLFHVSGHSVAALGEATGLIAVVVLAACLLPAQRAAALSPVRALAKE